MLFILKSDTIVSEIDSVKMASYMSNISRLLTYCVNGSNQDSVFLDLHNLVYSYSISKLIDVISFMPELRKKMRKDAERYFFLKKEAEEIG